jgi:hypothetical protein
MREVCALRHLSINTEKSYIHWLGRYASFLMDPKLKTLTAEKKMEAFLTRLAQTGMSASTQNQAFNALVFVSEKIHVHWRKDEPSCGRRFVLLMTWRGCGRWQT